jgi:AmmeMemoRadiSam system protein B
MCYHFKQLVGPPPGGIGAVGASPESGPPPWRPRAGAARLHLERAEGGHAFPRGLGRPAVEARSFTGVDSMRTFVALFAMLLLVVPAGIGRSQSGDPTVKELLEGVGIKPEGDHRGQMDTVGFATTAEQMDAVRFQCEKLAEARRKELYQERGWSDETAFIAGVCPHDDYYYAGRLYSLLIPHVKANTVVLFGVFHKARVFDCKDRLVFDSYRTWRGPYGPVNVSILRDEILRRLPLEDYTVDNDMQMVEHSVEAIVPWLQAYNRDVEIVSILVPYMGWDTMDRLAADLSDALAAVIAEKGWKLGRDIALISSADAIHYGDAGWGGQSYADFGTDVEGYKRAVARDMGLADDLLCGPFGGEADRAKLKDFLYRCVNPEDVTDYRITWCGRFSVPFGLDVASRLTNALESSPLKGTLLGYGTSVGEQSLDLEGLAPLGATAPNNLHHFVGYAAIGYE